MKVSVIGANHAGRDFHIPGLSTFPDVDLSVCDINQPLLKTVCDQFSIPPERRYTDYRQMLEKENPEAVFVLMAQYPHANYKPDIYFKIVNEVMDQGRNVLVEKPLAMTPAEAKPLVDKAEKTGLVTMVSVNRRFNPLVSLCKKAVEQNGPVLNVNCVFTKGVDPSPKEGALDWMAGDMIHALDLMRFLLGSEIVEFHSVVARTEADEVPTAFHALARCANGATGIFSANVRAGERIQFWQVHGVNVSAIIASEAVYPLEGGGNHMSATLYRPHEKPAVYRDVEPPTDRRYLSPTDFHVYSGFAYSDRYFINCVYKRQQPHCNFADAYKTLCLCHQIIQGETRVVTR